MDRDLSIIAQNAGTTAANLVATMVENGAITADSIIDEFEATRLVVFNGTLSLAGSEVTASQSPPTAEAAAEKVKAAFGGAEEVTTTFRIIEKGSTGQPAPDWLQREITYQVSRGKVAADDTDLFDNRASLPQFGGTGNPNAPWFRTAKGKVGLWPPRPKGGK